MAITTQGHSSREQGTVLVATLVLLLVLAVLSTTLASISGGLQMSTVDMAASTQAFFAAEAGIEISLKELVANSDVDGNGTTGSIDATAIGYATVVTTYAAGTLTSTATLNDTERVLVVTVSN